jgi:hypothetical protein
MCSRALRATLRPLFLLRLFQHRQIEFLLQPYVNGQADPGSWSELHEAYQYAHSQRFLTVPQEIKRSHELAPVETTIEREYVQLLLLDLANAGHFSPHDAFWVSQWLPAGSEELTLKSVRAGPQSAWRSVRRRLGQRGRTRADR